MNKSWTITVEEDPETGELILPFNDEILEAVNWQVGDTIEWEQHDNGSWTLRKKNENTKTDRTTD
jgi:hypothetical protein